MALKPFRSFEKTDRALAVLFFSFFSFKLPMNLIRCTAIAANVLQLGAVCVGLWVGNCAKVLLPVVRLIIDKF